MLKAEDDLSPGATGAVAADLVVGERGRRRGCWYSSWWRWRGKARHASCAVQPLVVLTTVYVHVPTSDGRTALRTHGEVPRPGAESLAELGHTGVNSRHQGRTLLRGHDVVIAAI